MKVSELEGRILDYEVWKIDGCVEGIKHLPAMPDYYSPSTNWDQGGPIIERKKIDIMYDYSDKEWSAEADTGEPEPFMWVEGRGPTPLIAAMRAHVASKYDDKEKYEP